MVFKKLTEELSKESVTKFRKLVHKFHPDKKGGDEELTKKLLSAKKREDEKEINRIFDKYFGDNKKDGSSKEDENLFYKIMKWVEDISDKYDIRTVTRRSVENKELFSKGDVIIDFFKNDKNAKRETMWDANKYKDEQSFKKAAEEFLKKKGLI